MIVLHPDPTTTAGRENDERFTQLQHDMDERFALWIAKRFAGLINLPPIPPVMLHHIPRFLARQAEEGADVKVALIVVDGLAMDQWLVIKPEMSLDGEAFRVHEHAVFAWIPTLTAVSRQSIFAGKPPIYFPKSVASTDREAAQGKQVWINHGLANNQIIYMKGLGDGGLDDVRKVVSAPTIKVVGLVVDKVDRIMHGMELGTAGMHGQVLQWARKHYLGSLVSLLLDRGFRVCLTSDHGNIEAEGIGRPSEGAVADLRGERVRIYSEVALRNHVKSSFPTAVEWASIGLPDHYFPLMPPSRSAFVSTAKRSVCHGGMTLEELIVPFVEIGPRRGVK